MNKKNNRKGFTTVELVIVIAVIAILATVLIPTFSNLVEKANYSKALQLASSSVKAIALENLDGDTHEVQYTDPTSKKVYKDLILVVDEKEYFAVVDGQLVECTSTPAEIEAGTYKFGNYTLSVQASGITATLKGANNNTTTYTVANLPETVVVNDLPKGVSVYNLYPAE